MNVVYAGRGNNIRLQLLADGEVVPDNSVQSAALWIPKEAFEDGQQREITSPSSELSLDANNTVLVISIGTVTELKKGRYVCRLTIYDGVNQEGIAWSEIVLVVNDWRA
jgi:hypothetical protein